MASRVVCWGCHRCIFTRESRTLLPVLVGGFQCKMQSPPHSVQHWQRANPHVSHNGHLQGKLWHTIQHCEHGRFPPHPGHVKLAHGLSVIASYLDSLRLGRLLLDRRSRLCSVGIAQETMRMDTSVATKAVANCSMQAMRALESSSRKRSG